jgi:hypothetical protein
MAKSLCDLKMSRKSDRKTLAKREANPTHFCKKCSRMANCKKVLCDAKKLKKLELVGC